MVWQVIAAKAVVGAIGGTLSAIAQKRQNDRQEASLERAMRSQLHSINAQSMRARGSAATRGNYAGASLGVNEAKDASMSSIDAYAMQRQSLRLSSTAGFINAAAGTSIDVGSAVGQYRSEQVEIEKTEKLESLSDG